MREIAHVIAAVNQAFLARNSTCYLKKTYFSKQLSKRLVFSGLVERIQNTESGYIILTLKHFGTMISKGVPLSIKACSKASQPIYLSAYALRSLAFQSRRKLLLLSVPKEDGIVSHDYCLKKGVGGMLVGIISSRA